MTQGRPRSSPTAVLVDTKMSEPYPYQHFESGFKKKGGKAKLEPDGTRLEDLR